MKTDRLLISLDISERELFNLQYVPDNIDIKISSNNYETFLRIAQKLNKYNKSNKLILNFTFYYEKEPLNKKLFSNSIDYKHIFINGSDGINESFNDYVECEKRLYKMVIPAQNLSPFEKYIFAYNKAKQFKKYNENYLNKRSARNLHQILNNDYIVCVGFSKLFCDLLVKLGINAEELTTTIDTSYDGYYEEKEPLVQEKPSCFDGHSRVFAYIVDKKYGIDGFYISDPTFDNNLDYDYYSYLALTPREECCLNRMIAFRTYGGYEFFDITSIEEFYSKIDFLISRKGSRRTLADVLSSIITRLSILDENQMNILVIKYPFINGFKSEWPDSDFTDLINDLYDYISNRVNKEIPGPVILSAIREVYDKTTNLTEEGLNGKMEDIIEVNQKIYRKNFPKVYKTNNDGKKLIKNKNNKFR